MKKQYRAALVAAVTLILAGAFGGCGETLKPDAADPANNNTGGGGAAAVVPGSGGQLTADSLNTEYNGGAGKHGMRICNITQGDVNKEDITTPGTLGLWEDGKFHIEGYSSTWNGTYANAGFTDVSILYYDQPFETGQEFKFSARVRILRAGGVSTGKGVHFGAYTTMRNPVVDEEGAVQFGTGPNSKGVGMFLRCEGSPQFRLYFSDSGSSTAAGQGAFGNLTDLKYTKEYIYELARVKLSDGKWYYTYKLFDSKSGDTVYNSVEDKRAPNNGPGGWSLDAEDPKKSNPWGAGVTLSHYLRPVPTHIHDDTANVDVEETTVYPGVCISGSAVEISQIKIWDSGSANWNYAANTGDTPIFFTPDTIPAYVPANYFTPVAVFKAPSDRFPGENVYVFSGENNLNWGGLQLIGFTISINPKGNLVPNYADDNIWFEFLTLQGHPALTLTGVTAHKAEGGLSTAYETGKLVIDQTMLISGETVKASYKIVARDPYLDVPGPEGVDAPDWSLKQTLPEYYFRMEITKP